MKLSCSLLALLAVPLMSVPSPSVAFAASAADVSSDFQWVDLSACRKPPVKKLPPKNKNSYRTYNVQRRYVDLDMDGACEVMDIWIERLGGNPSPGMRVLEQRTYRYKEAKWQRVAVGLKYLPYAVRSISTGEIFYIEAVTLDDIGDDMALGFPEIKISIPAGWDETPGFNDAIVLKPFEGRPGPLLQALAILLNGRLADLEAGRIGTAPMDRQFAWSNPDEGKRIRWLLNEANQTLGPAERVAVDGEGLPVSPSKR